jgi:hypothetical protein
LYLYFAPKAGKFEGYAAKVTLKWSEADTAFVLVDDAESGE